MQLVQAINFVTMAEEELREARSEQNPSPARVAGAVEGFRWSVARLKEAADAALVEVGSA